jgi:hypothetical protein
MVHMTQQQFWQLMMLHKKLQQRLGKRIVNIAAHGDDISPVLVTYYKGDSVESNLFYLEDNGDLIEEAHEQEGGL